MRKRHSPFDDIEREIVIPEYKPEMTTIECFDAVADNAEDSTFSEKFMQDYKPFLDRVAEAFQLNNNQIMLLCAFLSSCSNSIGQRELQNYFSCSNIRIIRLWDEVEDLCKKGFLTRCCGRTQSVNSEFTLTEEAITALRTGKPIVLKTNTDLTSSQYVSCLRKMISRKRRSTFSDEDFADELNEVNAKNQHLVIARELMECPLSIMGRAMLTYLLNRTLLSNGESFDIDDITSVFDDDPFGLRQELLNGNTELQREKYIQNVNVDGMSRKDTFELTEKAIDQFLSEFSLNTSGDSDMTGLIEPEKIVKKELFYSPEDGKQIASLSSLLVEEKIVAIRERLEKAGMRKGFCCLFYGAPGTGKTETAMQLAKQTGRAVMQVDFSQTRDMWYGNTEKNVKRIFTEYRNMAKRTHQLPILLFNEADAILSVRQTIAGNSHSTDKTENAIQNIILQEMEAFDGIMIATTNLTMNLDKAFERRFLYKVEFHRPTLEAKQQIWKAMLPDVKAEVLNRLAMHYDLTGGQIENVARKYMVNSILYGDTGDCYANLCDFCHQETASGNEGKKIGFV